MSNSFEVQPACAESVHLLVRILVAIAHECSTVGCDISQLGDALSETLVSDTGHHMVQFQSFDALTQNAHAQAKLIAHIARLLLLGREVSMHEILMQIADVPLPAVRQRLCQAIGASVAEADDETALWFEDTDEQKAKA